MRLVLLATLLGCAGRSDAAAREYADTMAPVFARNYELGQQFLSVASQLKQGQLDAPAVGQAFGRSAVPLAQELANRASAVSPEDEALAAAHQRLVAAWKERALAYEAASTAFGGADPVAFDEAAKRVEAVRAMEVEYLDVVNGATRPVGVVIDLYPTPQAAP